VESYLWCNRNGSNRFAVADRGIRDHSIEQFDVIQSFPPSIFICLYNQKEKRENE
jgi:hypothetical protein